MLTWNSEFSGPEYAGQPLAGFSTPTKKILVASSN